MTELFFEVASIDYPIIDSDAHVNEPPELWQERVPSRLQEPRAEGAAHAPTATCGRSTTARSCGRSASPPPPASATCSFAPPGMRYESIRPGSFDTAARLQGPRRRRHLRAAPLPERHPRRRPHLQRRPRAAVRLRARLQRVAAANSARRRAAGSFRRRSFPTTGIDDAVAELRLGDQAAATRAR